MRNPRLLWRIFSAFWSSPKGDGSNAHVLRQTDEIMGAAGFGKGSGPAFSDEMVNALYSPAWEDMWRKEFSLSAAQIDLIKRAQLVWEPAEAGAPKLSLRTPYAGGTTPEQLTRLLGDDAREEDKQALLISMVQAFSTFCDKAVISSGEYNVSSSDRAVSDQTIQLSDDLIALVRNLQWDWPDEDYMGVLLFDGEVAGPRCDCKRPYGDMSFFALDIHRILGWEAVTRNEQGYVEITDAQAAEAEALHSQILPALRAVLAYGDVLEGKA